MELQKFSNTTLDLIDTNIKFALENGVWLNATDIAKKYGKRLDNYFSSKDTIEYMDAVVKAATLKISVANLKQTVNRGDSTSGTYIHPDLIIHFARFINAEFAIACDRWIKTEIVKINEIKTEAIIMANNKELQLVTEIKDKEIARIKAESKLLNNYNGFISVTKFTSEIFEEEVTPSFMWEALEYAGWLKNVKIVVTERRLDESCPIFVGTTIPKSKTPIYTEVGLRFAHDKYVEYLREKATA